MQEEYLQELEDYRQNMEFSKHFNMLIGKIADYPDSLLVSLSRIDKQYKDSEDEIEKLHAQRKRLLEKKRTLDAKIEEAKKKHGVDPIQQAGTANLLNNNIPVIPKNFKLCQTKKLIFFQMELETPMEWILLLLWL